MSTLDDFLKHPIDQLEKALQLRKQIDALQEGLSSLFSKSPLSNAGIEVFTPKRKGKRKMSPEAKAKIAAAQRARWAKTKGSEPTAESAPVAKPKKKKGKMSAAGRARIIAAQKARWAKVKAGKAASASAKVTPAPPKPAARMKRQLSPEARARIVAAVKARWAKVKKGTS